MSYVALDVLGEGITDCTSFHCSDSVTEFAPKETVVLPLTPPKDCCHGHKTP